MKKFLILMLVLGMASTASAVLTPITTWTDGICTWTLDIANSKIYGTGTSIASDYLSPLIQQSSGTGRLDPTPLANLGTGGYKDGTYNAAGDLGNFVDPYAGQSGFEGFYWTAQSKDAGATLPDKALGLWFEADVTYANNDFIMTFYNGAAFETALQGTIPEPVTIALLGLGGLFLRRRK
jgi:hypothetical protein